MEYHVIELTKTSSTNDEAKKLAFEGCPSGTVVTAKKQVSGRGRLGRSWDSKDGGLFFSIVLRGGMWHESPGLLTLTAGVAIANALNQIFEKDSPACFLKWPNDVMIRGKKICGILAERDVLGDIDFVVLGIGVNVNVERFPPELSNIATSLFLETGEHFDITTLLNSILDCFGVLQESLESGYRVDILNKYKKLCLNIGRPVIITKAPHDERITGIAIDVDGGGELVVRTEDGLMTVRSGEVTLRDKEAAL